MCRALLPLLLCHAAPALAFRATVSQSAVASSQKLLVVPPPKSQFSWTGHIFEANPGFENAEEVMIVASEEQSGSHLLTLYTKLEFEHEKGEIFELKQTPPRVEFITPFGGPVGAPTAVTLAGVAMGAVTDCKVGEQTFSASTKSVWPSAYASSTVCGVSSGSSSVEEITISTDHGNTWLPTAFAFHYFAPPTLSELQPKGVPVGVSATIVVHGDGMDAFAESNSAEGGYAAKCRFGSQITNVTAVSSKHMSCPTPPSPTAGNVPVSVSLNGQDWSSPLPFTFYAPPLLDYITPHISALNSTKAITLVGEGFAALSNSTPQCKFGGHIATATAPKEAKGNWMVCVAPVSTQETRLPVTLSLNGVHFHGATKVIFLDYDQNAVLKLPIQPSKPKPPERRPEEERHHNSFAAAVGAIGLGVLAVFYVGATCKNFMSGKRGLDMLPYMQQSQYDSI